jgi:acetyl esterase/lipase
MSSMRAKIMRSISSAYLQRMNVAKVDVRKIRRLWNFLGGMMITAFGVKIARDEINGLYAEWLTPKDRMDGKLLLYLHGGAYVLGGCDMYRQMVSHMARAGRIQALLPEYRLSPEHKYPAAIDDAVGIYRTLLQQGIKPESIVFAGDSAGGGLAVATLLALRDAGDPLPAAAVLLSPFLDVSGSGESMQSRAMQDPWFHAEDISTIADYYCAAEQRREPLVSPVFADVGGLPPLYIQVGDDEILLSDSERIAQKIEVAGGEVELEVWPKMWHVFQMFIGKMPESGRAIRKIGDYVRGRFA